MMDNDEIGTVAEPIKKTNKFFPKIEELQQDYWDRFGPMLPLKYHHYTLTAESTSATSGFSGYNKNPEAKFTKADLERNGATFTEVRPEIKGTIWEEMLYSLGWERGKVRLLVLPPGFSWHMHTDNDAFRCTLSIWSNEHSYLIYKDPPVVKHFPTDGTLWAHWGQNMHTAINGHPEALNDFHTYSGQGTDEHPYINYRAHVVFQQGHWMRNLGIDWPNVNGPYNGN